MPLFELAKERMPQDLLPGYNILVAKVRGLI